MKENLTESPKDGKVDVLPKRIDEVDLPDLSPKAPNITHSSLGKARFAGTLASIFLGLSLASPAKDFYVEKLGGNPIVMGVVFFAVSFLAPLNEVISGRLQNRAVLRRCFPVEKWGRKAPWLCTHVVLLAIASGVLYLPPSRDPIMVHAWFFVVSVVLFWAISTNLIAFESCRQEIYIYNEDRSSVELFCKVACAVGITLAALPLLVLLSNANIYLRLAASAFFVLASLALGLQAKPTWMQATSDSKQEQSNICHDFKQSWQNKAFRHLACVRFWEGCYQGLQTTNLWYYLTYIVQLFGVQRSIAVVVVGVVSFISDLSVSAYVQRQMTKRTMSFRIQKIVVVCRALDVVVTAVLLLIPIYFIGGDAHAYGSHSLFVDRALFLTWTALNRAFQSPFTFWRVGAQCWVIDEDVHLANGTRREAAFISVASAAQNFARAVSAALAFLGYGLVGFAPKDCEAICRIELETVMDCLDICMAESVVSQPNALRWYIRMINIVGLIVAEMMIVFHTWSFPIKGIRLAKLYNNQTAASGGTVDTGSQEEQQRKLQKKLTPTLQSLAKAQHSLSVVVTNDDPSEGAAFVRNVQRSRRVTGKGVSTSVIFGPASMSLSADPACALSPIANSARLPSSSTTTPTSLGYSDHYLEEDGNDEEHVRCVPRPSVQTDRSNYLGLSPARSELRNVSQFDESKHEFIET